MFSCIFGGSVEARIWGREGGQQRWPMVESGEHRLPQPENLGRTSQGWEVARAEKSNTHHTGFKTATPAPPRPPPLLRCEGLVLARHHLPTPSPTAPPLQPVVRLRVLRPLKGALPRGREDPERAAGAPTPRMRPRAQEPPIPSPVQGLSLLTTHPTPRWPPPTSRFPNCFTASSSWPTPQFHNSPTIETRRGVRCSPLLPTFKGPPTQ